MKERVYKIKPERMFCPSCHREVNFPFKGNMSITGNIRIACNCKGGVVIIQGEKSKEEDKKEENKKEK